MNKIKRYLAAIGNDIHIPWQQLLKIIAIVVACVSIVGCFAITIGLLVNYLTEQTMDDEETLNLGLGLMIILVMIGGVITYLINKWKGLD